MNLLEETKRHISAQFGESFENQVLAVVIRDASNAVVASSSWDEFCKIAEDFDYDSGYGLAMVNSDLVILFKDKTWSERHEYDGSEWWQYCKAPKITNKPVAKLSQRMISHDFWVGY